MQKARQILLERRQALENVTKRLIEIEVMDSDELRRLIDDTLPGPRVKPGTQGHPRGADDEPSDSPASSHPEATDAAG